MILFELRARVTHPLAWLDWYWRKFTTHVWCSSCRETIVGYCWAHAPTRACSYPSSEGHS